jgi:hypothetical protein
LQQIGAYTGGRLPMLEGFVRSDTAELERYSRAYYQYKIQLTAVDAGHTVVRVEAKISAWYSAPEPAGSEYRSLVSSGRLEADLLDHLQDALNSKSSKRPADARSPHTATASSPAPAPPATQTASKAQDEPLSPQKQLENLRAERQAVEEKTQALAAQIQAMEEAAHSQAAAAPQFASVNHTGAAIMSGTSDGGPVRFRARAEDEFEVVEQQREWVSVRLGKDSTGWIRSDQVTLPADKVESASPAPSKQSSQRDLGFWISREEVNLFSGDWTRLKGKKVLFVFAQPRGVLADIARDDRKLAYAKQIFADRYRASTHSQDPFAGVVVIFMGGRGGVAAAALADIQQWVEGGLPDDAFVKRCSLDPLQAFRGPHAQ